MNPEELIASALSSCMSMKVSAEAGKLEGANLEVESVRPHYHYIIIQFWCKVTVLLILDRKKTLF